VSFNATAGVDGSPPSSSTPVSLSVVTLGGSEWADPAQLCAATTYTSVLAGLQPLFTTQPYCGGPQRVPTRSSVVMVLERESPQPPPSPPSPRPSHSVTPTPAPAASGTPGGRGAGGAIPAALVGEWSGGLALNAAADEPASETATVRCMPQGIRQPLVVPGTITITADGGVKLSVARPPPSRLPPNTTVDATLAQWWVAGSGPWTLPPPWSLTRATTWDQVDEGVAFAGTWNGTSHVLTLRASGNSGGAPASWMWVPVPQPADAPAPVGSALTVLVGAYVNGTGDDAAADAWVQQSGWLLAGRMNGSTTLPASPPLPCPIPAPFVPGGQPLAGRFVAGRWDVVGGGGGGGVRPAQAGAGRVAWGLAALVGAVAAAVATAGGAQGWRV
jgi:hypothetical protein